MKYFETLAIVNVPMNAVVLLSSDQARRRAHLIEPIEVNEKDGSGLFSVKSPIQFKIGEVLGIHVDKIEDIDKGARGKYAEVEFDKDGNAVRVPEEEEEFEIVDPDDGAEPETIEEDDVDFAEEAEENEVEADANGVPYDSAIHYANKAKDENGLWKVKKG